MKKDNGQFIPELYARFGSYPNNTTIPDSEKQRNMLQWSEQGPDQEKSRAILRGQQAFAAYLHEAGLAPASECYMDYMGYEVSPHFDIYSVPLSVQRAIRGRGRLPKSERNARIAKDRRTQSQI